MTCYAKYILEAYTHILSLPEDELDQIGRNNSEDSNPIPSFDENLLKNLCSEAKKVFLNEDIMLKIEGDVIVVGDIHGSYHDLLRILQFFSKTENKILFLGDYIDRGNFSLECVTLLFSYKIQYPEKFFLLRGNHEFDSMGSQYGFKNAILNYHNPKKVNETTKKTIFKSQGQIKVNLENEEEKEIETTEMLCDTYFAKHSNTYCYKYTEDLYESFIDAFSYLPIAATVNDTTFCIHGGLSPQLDKIEKISKFIKRPIVKFDENQLLTDLLWSDPSPDGDQCFCENPRGRGKLFNRAATFTFLRNNNMKKIIRAHECVNDGIELNFNEKCITVFSASSYNRDLGNKSGIIQLFDKSDRIDSIVFKPFKRLNKCDAFYYKVQTFVVSDVSKLLFASCNSNFSMNGPIDNDKNECSSILSIMIKRDSDSKYVMKSSSFAKRKRSLSLNQSLSFTTGPKIKKNNVGSLFSKDSLHNNIPRLRNLNDDNDSNQKNSSNNGCLPFLNKNINIQLFNNGYK